MDLAPGVETTKATHTCVAFVCNSWPTSYSFFSLLLLSDFALSVLPLLSDFSEELLSSFLGVDNPEVDLWSVE